MSLSFDSPLSRRGNTRIKEDSILSASRKPKSNDPTQSDRRADVPASRSNIARTESPSLGEEGHYLCRGLAATQQCETLALAAREKCPSAFARPHRALLSPTSRTSPRQYHARFPHALLPGNCRLPPTSTLDLTYRVWGTEMSSPLFVSPLVSPPTFPQSPPLSSAWTSPLLTSSTFFCNISISGAKI